jgi:hypothetical protein
MTIPRYIDLNMPAPYRLACLRRDFEQWFVRNPHAPRDRVKSWRDVRFYNLRSSETGLSQGFNGLDSRKVPVWYCHAGTPFKREKKAHEILDFRHTGYYTDEDCSGLAIGIVARLSHNRFIAGYEWTDNGERVYFGDIYTDEEDAARAADHYAERFAEISREDSYKWNEARDIERENEDNLQRLRECIALRNKSCVDYVRDEIHELIESIRENRERLNTEFKEYC